VPVDLALRWQISYCTGSPVAVQILEAVRADVAAGGALASLLPGEVVFSRLVGLRVMAAVHRLALERRAPRIALHLPTLGGTAPSGAAERTVARVVVEVLTDHPDVLAESRARIPQTNDPGRSGLLRAAMSRLDPSLPVRLRETGTSAGLNLRPDHLPGLAWLEAGPLPPVLDRAGCDRDPSTSARRGRLLLSSYVWVDDVPRFAALAHAFEVASRVPADVLRRTPSTSSRAAPRARHHDPDLAQRLLVLPRCRAATPARLGDRGVAAAATPRPRWPTRRGSGRRTTAASSGLALVLRRWDGDEHRGSRCCWPGAAATATPSSMRARRSSSTIRCSTERRAPPVPGMRRGPGPTRPGPLAARCCYSAPSAARKSCTTGMSTRW
jgi:hypothetical protein